MRLLLLELFFLLLLLVPAVRGSSADPQYEEHFSKSDAGDYTDDFSTNPDKSKEIDNEDDDYNEPPTGVAPLTISSVPGGTLIVILISFGYLLWEQSKTQKNISRKIHKYKTEVMAAESKNDQVLHELNCAKSQIWCTETQLQTVQKELKEAQVKVEKLTKLLEQKEISEAALKEELGRYQKLVATLQFNEARLQEQLQQDRTQINYLESELGKVKSDFGHFQSIFASVTQEKDSLEKKVKCEEEKAKEAQDMVMALQQELKVEQERVEVEEEKKKTVEKNYQQLVEMEKDKIKTLINNCKETEATMKHLNCTLAEITKNKQAVEEKLLTSEKEKEGAIVELEQKQNELRKANQQLLNNQAMNSDLASMVEVTNREKIELVNQLTDIRKEKLLYSKRLQAMQNDNKDLRIKISEFKVEKINMKKILSSTLNEKKLLKRRMDSVYKESEVLKEEVARYKQLELQPNKHKSLKNQEDILQTMNLAPECSSLGNSHPTPATNKKLNDKIENNFSGSQSKKATRPSHRTNLKHNLTDRRKSTLKVKGFRSGNNINSGRNYTKCKMSRTNSKSKPPQKGNNTISTALDTDESTFILYKNVKSGVSQNNSKCLSSDAEVQVYYSDNENMAVALVQGNCMRNQQISKSQNIESHFSTLDIQNIMARSAPFKIQGGFQNSLVKIKEIHETDNGKVLPNKVDSLVATVEADEGSSDNCKNPITDGQEKVSGNASEKKLVNRSDCVQNSDTNSQLNGMHKDAITKELTSGETFQIPQTSRNNHLVTFFTFSNHRFYTQESSLLNNSSHTLFPFKNKQNEERNNILQSENDLSLKNACCQNSNQCTVLETEFSNNNFNGSESDIVHPHCGHTHGAEVLRITELSNRTETSTGGSQCSSLSFISLFAHDEKKELKESNFDFCLDERNKRRNGSECSFVSCEATSAKQDVMEGGVEHIYSCGHKGLQWDKLSGTNDSRSIQSIGSKYNQSIQSTSTIPEFFSATKLDLNPLNSECSEIEVGERNENKGKRSTRPSSQQERCVNVNSSANKKQNPAASNRITQLKKQRTFLVGGDKRISSLSNKFFTQHDDSGYKHDYIEKVKQYSECCKYSGLGNLKKLGCKSTSLLELCSSRKMTSENKTCQSHSCQMMPKVAPQAVQMKRCNRFRQKWKLENAIANSKILSAYFNNMKAEGASLHSENENGPHKVCLVHQLSHFIPNIQNKPKESLDVLKPNPSKLPALYLADNWKVAHSSFIPKADWLPTLPSLRILSSEDKSTCDNTTEGEVTSLGQLVANIFTKTNLDIDVSNTPALMTDGTENSTLTSTIVPQVIEVDNVVQ